MGSFSWMGFSIDMTRGAVRCETADLQAPAGDALISFAHEYIHFLHSIGSVVGLKLMGELLDLGMKGAMLLDGQVSADGGDVKQQPILPLLAKQLNGAGRSSADLQPRIESLLLEGSYSLDEQVHDNVKPNGAWSYERIQYQPPGFSEATEWGLLRAPSGRRRPITVGLLTENMARRVDRWLARNEHINVTWIDGVVEQEHYNGIYNLLQDDRFSRNIKDAGHAADVTVIVAMLALAAVSPNRATLIMLDFLATRNAGLLPETIWQTLRAELEQQGLLNAGLFNEVIEQIVRSETLRAMPAVDAYEVVREHLRPLERLCNDVLTAKKCLVERTVRAKEIVTLMQRFSLPRVVCVDGEANEVAGVPVRRETSAFFREVERVFLM